jgi:polyhydroxyalkanoate synthesis regulator phasin
VAKNADKHRQTRAESVRAAAAQAFSATAGQAQMTRERAQELADELAGAASRVRDALDDLRSPSGDDIRELRAEIRNLQTRVKALEDERAPAKRRPAPAAKKRSTPPAAKRSGRSSS